MLMLARRKNELQENLTIDDTFVPKLSSLKSGSLILPRHVTTPRNAMNIGMILINLSIDVNSSYHWKQCCMDGQSSSKHNIKAII